MLAGAVGPDQPPQPRAHAPACSSWLAACARRSAFRASVAVQLSTDRARSSRTSPRPPRRDWRPKPPQPAAHPCMPPAPLRTRTASCPCLSTDAPSVRSARAADPLSGPSGRITDGSCRTGAPTTREHGFLRPVRREPRGRHNPGPRRLHSRALQAACLACGVLGYAIKYLARISDGRTSLLSRRTALLA